MAALSLALIACLPLSQALAQYGNYQGRGQISDPGGEMIQRASG